MNARAGLYLLVASLLGIALHAQASPPEAALVGWWTFDEADGLAAMDSSGNANHGALSTPSAPVFPGSPFLTAASPQRIPGRIGSGALRFDKYSPSVVRIPDSPSLRVDYVTVGVWLRSDGHPGPYNYFLAKGGQDCWGPTFSLNIEGDGLLYMRLTTNGYDSIGGTLTPVLPEMWDGEWHYVVGMYGPESTRIYVDGALVAQGIGLGVPLGHDLSPTADLFIGGFVGACLFGASGDIDDLKIWSGTFEEPPLGEGPSYAIAPLYEPAKAHPAGSTMPLKIQVLDGSGANVSSSALPVTIAGATFRQTGALVALEASGKSNRDGAFRFDASMAGGGYVYNASTRGLAAGTYDVALTVGADPHLYQVSFTIR